MELTCFKAYDIRGQLNQQLDEKIAFRIGLAFAEHTQAQSVVVGGDIRLTSRALVHALSAGLIQGGSRVVDLGLTGTEEIYFATKFSGADGGIEVTASHNPADYNGMKFVGKGAVPISADSGLNVIKSLAEGFSEEQIDSAFSEYAESEASADEFFNGKASIEQPTLENTGQYQTSTYLPEYIAHILSYIDIDALPPLKVVVNAGNGAAGHVVDAIEAHFNTHKIPVKFIKIHHTPDGSFPNGIPNPLLPESRQDTADAVIKHHADFGIAWDGDFDRCFLFDEHGQFIEGYYIVGLLAEAFLRKHEGEKVIYDPRVYWNTESIIKANAGEPIMSKTGHAFIKERMREENAIYGGEMSAHHYFRDFAYCDSGMIPWLLVAELISVGSSTLSEMVSARIKAYPSSGEINRRVSDAKNVMNEIEAYLKPDAIRCIKIDGLGLEFEQWRFNLRMSNTEPLLRLNVEAKGDKELMLRKTAMLINLIDKYS
ncbi:phosphomannomutase CpsG [Aestuariibacter sp. AA17]|uniref:phosphomannomutase n=1 Tax=Fluctibacter corallii TaxID=2984329 RepID=A0ABT3A8G9_9ALTE|nr:phosphomannomutase CpsG [Aestuariibacter sp. AA17]MCV2884900.1 phosphomannomutase CpsG [Aestuariibacter sp. AA17]